jgi:hypothetical protein
VHLSIRASVNSCICQLVHLLILASVHSCICRILHLSVRASVNSCICPFLHLSILASVHSCICQFLHVSIRASVNSCICPFVHLSILASVRMEERDCHVTDLRGVSYLGFLLTSVEVCRRLLKMDKHNRHFICRPTYIYVSSLLLGRDCVFFVVRTES